MRKIIESNDDASHYVSSLRPDALIFLSDEIDRTTLRQMRSITQVRPTPMLVFTRDSQQASIDAAVKAGASAYIVDCDNPERLPALIEVASSRFNEQQRLSIELKQTKTALQERKMIDRAKGIIMKNKKLSEEQAYNALRKLAMDHNKRIGEIAEQIISAAEVLV